MEINLLGLAAPTFTTTTEGVFTNMVFDEAIWRTHMKKNGLLVRAHCSDTIRVMKIEDNKMLCFYIDVLQIYDWSFVCKKREYEWSNNQTERRKEETNSNESYLTAHVPMQIGIIQRRKEIIYSPNQKRWLCDVLIMISVWAVDRLRWLFLYINVWAIGRLRGFFLVWGNSFLIVHCL